MRTRRGDVFTTVYGVAWLQLVNDLAEGTPMRVCANETCQRSSLRQLGRSLYGQNRTEGIRYCSAECAKAQARASTGDARRPRGRRTDERQPQDGKGRRRTVTLDPATLAALREHGKAAGRRAAPARPWVHRSRPRVLPRRRRSTASERFSRTFADRARQLGLPTIRLHDLRHTWATLALAGGEHPRVILDTARAS